jgi:hypothetical protein
MNMQGGTTIRRLTTVQTAGTVVRCGRTTLAQNAAADR